jgi:hypothetical protein
MKTKTQIQTKRAKYQELYAFNLMEFRKEKEKSLNDISLWNLLTLQQKLEILKEKIELLNWMLEE